MAGDDNKGEGDRDHGPAGRLGKAILERRGELGWTQAKLADEAMDRYKDLTGIALRISASYVGFVERGEREPSASRAAALARALGLSVESLVAERGLSQPEADGSSQTRQTYAKLLDLAERDLEAARLRIAQSRGFIYTHALDTHAPRVGIIPIKDVMPHERHDEARMNQIRDSLSKVSILHHPVIVGRSTTGTCVLLDGVNRLTALDRLGVKLIAVQEVEYADDRQDSVLTESWVLAADVREDDVRAIGSDRIHVVRMSSRDALELVNRGEAVACVVFPSRHALAIQGADSLEWTHRAISAVYGAAIGHERWAIPVDPESVDSLFDGGPVTKPIMVFRSLWPSEVTQLAERKLLLPFGVTRHYFAMGRVHFADASVEVLRLPLEEANGKLRDAMAARGWRRYSDPVFSYYEGESTGQR